MIYAFTASLPDRVNTLKKSVYSIIDQVDHIQVVLNNYTYVPDFLNHPKITVVRHDNSLEDGSRFINIEKRSGYILVFDDDIEYPKDYVKRLVEICYEHTVNYNPCMVTPMGKVLKQRPVKSYYRDILHSYKTFEKVEGWHNVDVPGACGILWHSEYVKVTQGIILTPNSDLCLAKFCKENNVTALVIDHEANWLKNLMPEIPNKNTLSIYGKYRRNDAKLTEFVNKYL
jgi:hypothetical protein